jgi:cbb3-type cytochrome oxidase subunit 3
MSLADIMGGSGFSLFAEIGLLVALGAFAGVVAGLCRRANRDAFERARHLPLEDDDA